MAYYLPTYYLPSTFLSSIYLPIIGLEQSYLLFTCSLLTYYFPMYSNNNVLLYNYYLFIIQVPPGVIVSISGMGSYIKNSLCIQMHIAHQWSHICLYKCRIYPEFVFFLISPWGGI